MRFHNSHDFICSQKVFFPLFSFFTFQFGTDQQSGEKVVTLENLGKAPQGTEMSPRSGLSSSNSQNNLIIRATGEMIIGVNGITASSSANGNLFIGAHGDMAIKVTSGDVDSGNENSAQSDCNNGEIESRKDVHVQMANEDTLAVANGNGKKKGADDSSQRDSIAEETVHFISVILRGFLILQPGRFDN